MFGDLFSQRGNYSHGLFYSGHRKYLIENQSSLLPPDEFKTKRQQKNTTRTKNVESSDEKMSFQINFQKKHEAEEPDPNKKLKKVVPTLKKVVSFVDYSSLNEKDWITTVEAGVHLWINKSTGEVSPVCPWLSSEKFNSMADSSEEKSIALNIPEKVEELGTGFLVYERDDLDMFFAQLDKMK